MAGFYISSGPEGALCRSCLAKVGKETPESKMIVPNPYIGLDHGNNKSGLMVSCILLLSAWFF